MRENNVYQKWTDKQTLNPNKRLLKDNPGKLFFSHLLNISECS